MFLSQQGYLSQRDVFGVRRVVQDKTLLFICPVEGKLRSPLLFNLMSIQKTTLGFVSEGIGETEEGDGTN